MTSFIPLIEGRIARLAYHPYGADPSSASFSPDDFPYVGYGNMGAVSGWLISQWPDHTELWNEISFTESGINSAAPTSSPGAQATAICQTFWNVLGTPGIDNYIWHRLIDTPTDPTDNGLDFGLIDASGNTKPAWQAFTHANNPARYSCGWGNMPNTKLQRSHSTTVGARNHWVSTRLPPPGVYSGDKAYVHVHVR